MPLAAASGARWGPHAIPEAQRRVKGNRGEGGKSRGSPRLHGGAPAAREAPATPAPAAPRGLVGPTPKPRARHCSLLGPGADRGAAWAPAARHQAQLVPGRGSMRRPRVMEEGDRPGSRQPAPWGSPHGHGQLWTDPVLAWEVAVLDGGRGTWLGLAVPTHSSPSARPRPVRAIAHEHGRQHMGVCSGRCRRVRPGRPRAGRAASDARESVRRFSKQLLASNLGPAGVFRAQTGPVPAQDPLPPGKPAGPHHPVAPVSGQARPRGPCPTSPLLPTLSARGPPLAPPALHSCPNQLHTSGSAGSKQAAVVGRPGVSRAHRPTWVPGYGGSRPPGELDSPEPRTASGRDPERCHPQCPSPGTRNPRAADLPS